VATLAKKPLQVYLRPEQLEALRGLAQRRGVSLAALVREGVDKVLAEVPAEEDPLWNIVGIVHGSPTDLAKRHDEYLARMIEEESR
jgi:hypothetical protein